MTLAKNGVTADTLKNIFKGSGTVYKNLTFTTDAWTGTVLGATSGGNSIEITPDLGQFDIDGVLVPVMGADYINSYTAKATVKLVEAKQEAIKLATLAEAGTSADATMDLLQLKDHVDATAGTGDYVDNISVVFNSADDDSSIIFVLENAICTSGLKFDGTQKDPTVLELTFEPRAAALTAATTLPVKIYTKKAV